MYAQCNSPLCIFARDNLGVGKIHKQTDSVGQSRSNCFFFIKNNVIVLGGNVSHPHLRNKIKLELVDILILLVSRGKYPGGGSRDS